MKLLDGYRFYAGQAKLPSFFQGGARGGRGGTRLLVKKIV